MSNVSVLTQPISLKVFKRGFQKEKENQEGTQRPKWNLFRAMKIIHMLLTPTLFLQLSWRQSKLGHFSI